MTILKKDDKNWEYCVCVGKDINGKKKYKRKNGFKTKKECMEAAKAISNKKLSLNKNRRTFKDISLLFLDKCNSKGLKLSTIITYKNTVKLILDKFDSSNKNIKNIKPQDIQNFIEYEIKMYSSSYKRKILEIFRCVFKFAKSNKFISNNIFDDISLPPLKRKIINLWTEEDIKKYLPILKKFKYYDLVYFVIETGLRRGEVAALTWDCVDFDRNIITINKSYVYTSGRSEISEPKTNAGIRQIVLLNESAKLLKKLYKSKNSKYVFPNHSNVNLPINTHTISSCFHKFLVKHNMKLIRFHDLRHLHATLLLNKNVNYKILSKRLGHSNVSFTLQTYTHVVLDTEIKLFKDISRLF